jgi:hypothetical protein
MQLGDVIDASPRSNKGQALLIQTTTHFDGN